MTKIEAIDRDIATLFDVAMSLEDRHNEIRRILDRLTGEELGEIVALDLERVRRFREEVRS